MLDVASESAIGPMNRRGMNWGLDLPKLPYLPKERTSSNSSHPSLKRSKINKKDPDDLRPLLTPTCLQASSVSSEDPGGCELPPTSKEIWNV